MENKQVRIIKPDEHSKEYLKGEEQAFSESLKEWDKKDNEKIELAKKYLKGKVNHI